MLCGAAVDRLACALNTVVGDNCAVVGAGIEGGLDANGFRASASLSAICYVPLKHLAPVVV